MSVLAPWFALLCLVLPASDQNGTADDEPAALVVEGLPDRLTLPLPEGTNRIITARITGARARSVWISRQRSSTLKLTLQSVGGGQHQLNLSDPNLAAIVNRPGANRLQVFAELEEGRVLESVVITYRRRPARVGPPTTVVHHRDGSSKTLHRWGENWITPSRVLRIETTFAARPPESVSARVGAEAHPFTLSQEETFVLEVTPPLRDQWQKKGRLTVETARSEHRRHLAVLRARPDALDLEGRMASVTVKQRQSQKIPGSRDFLYVSLDDITGGQVLTRVWAASGEEVVTATSLRQGESLVFTLGSRSYTLRLTQLVNQLFGTDWAVVDVTDIPPKALTSIDALLTRVETAEITFWRGDQSYTGKQAAEHLRTKMRLSPKPIGTVKEFIEKIASHSSTTGKDYEVELPDGLRVTARKWLEAQAKKKSRPKTDGAEAQNP